MAVLPNLIRKLSKISITIPASYFVCINKPIQKFTWKAQRPIIFNVILEKESKVEGITLSNYEAYCEVTIIKATWYWWKNRHADQLNRIKSSVTDHRVHWYEQYPLDFNQLLKEKIYRHLELDWPSSEGYLRAFVCVSIYRYQTPILIFTFKHFLECYCSRNREENLHT